ncbi:MAG: hypothetical protein K0S07_1263 [Chlamydiales bacterium]|jgi:hypothetical protein|nr:hypothetical protein [Chlamydiales bacterium]
MTPVDFNNGRCFFPPLNLENDQGVNYCRYQFIGAIFSLIGISFRFECEYKNKPFTCHIYKGSFINWIKTQNSRIKAHFSLPPKIDLAHAKFYVDKIRAIYTHYINPGVPLSVEQIKKKAEKEYLSHPNKERILGKIDKELGRVKYTRCVADRIYPYFRTDHDEYDAFTGMHGRPEKLEIKQEAQLFLEGLPGINRVPYQGLKLI